MRTEPELAHVQLALLTPLDVSPFFFSFFIFFFFLFFNCFNSFGRKWYAAWGRGNYANPLLPPFSNYISSNDRTEILPPNHLLYLSLFAPRTCKKHGTLSLSFSGRERRRVVIDISNIYSLKPKPCWQQWLWTKSPLTANHNRMITSKSQQNYAEFSSGFHTGAKKPKANHVVKSSDETVQWRQGQKRSRDTIFAKDRRERNTRLKEMNKWDLWFFHVFFFVCLFSFFQFWVFEFLLEAKADAWSCCGCW